MFCPKCGAQVDDEADVCVHCGRSLKQKVEEKPEYAESKTGIGVLLGLFLGLIGLIIGICIYPENTVARKTFIKAWGITFGVSIAVIIVFYVILLASTISAVGL